MKLVLATFSRTFVTRERARDLLTILGDEGGPTVTVDAAGVSISPSFTAELLTGLATRFMSVEVIATTDTVSELVESLTRKLGLAGRVTVKQVSPA